MTSFKLEYIPGIRPAPMIAVFNDVNKDSFNEIKNECNSKLVFNKTFFDDSIHFWSPNAYIIYNNNLEIISFVYNDISHFFFLLRILNKKIVFKINAENINLIKNEFQDWMNELNII